MNQQRLVLAEVDVEKLQVRNYETCIYKIMSGDTRIGHRILNSSALHPAFDTTCVLLNSKFLLEDEKDTMASRPDLRTRGSKCKAIIITEAFVG